MSERIHKSLINTKCIGKGAIMSQEGLSVDSVIIAFIFKGVLSVHHTKSVHYRHPCVILGCKPPVGPATDIPAIHILNKCTGGDPARAGRIHNKFPVKTGI